MKLRDLKDYSSLSDSAQFREMAKKYENYLDRNDPRLVRMLDAVRRANANLRREQQLKQQKGDLRKDDVVREQNIRTFAK